MSSKRLDELSDEELSKELQVRRESKKESTRPVNRTSPVDTGNTPQKPDLLSASMALDMIGRCREKVCQLEDKLAPVLSDESKGENKESVSPVIDRLSDLFDLLDALYERIHV